MTLLDAVVSWLVQHGPTLLLGATIVLAAGCVALLASRSLEQRRRIGVLTALGTSLYLVLGAIPLPRVAWPELGANENPQGPLVDTVRASLPPAVDPELRAAALERALADLQVDAAPASPPPSTPESAEVLSAAAQSPEAQPDEAQPAAAEPAAGEAAFGWPMVLASTWLLGALFFLLRHLVGTARLHRLLAACSEVAPAAVPGFAMPKGTRLLLSPHRVRPFCAGLVRPVIVLPNELMQPDRLAEAKAVLAHEASHLRAGDSRVATLLAWLAIPLFCHPLYWWLCREVRFCNELLADDDAAGPDRNSYARALLDLAEHDQPALAASGSVAVFHRPSEFYRRIQMLLQRRGSLSSRTSRLCRATSALAALCFVGTVAGLFGTPAAAQEPGNRERKEAELRETIAALRAEISELRALLQARQAERDTPRDHVTDVTRMARDVSAQAGLRNLLEGSKPGDSREAARRRALSHADHYVVKQGDTLERIAKQELGDASRMDVIRRLNPDLDPQRLRVGQTVYLPDDHTSWRTAHGDSVASANRRVWGDNRDYRVQEGDTLERIALRQLGNEALQDEVRRLNPDVDWDKLTVGQSLLLPHLTDHEKTLRWLAQQQDQPNRFPTPLAGGSQPRGQQQSGELPDLPARPGQDVPQRSGMPGETLSPANATGDLATRYLDLQAEIEIADAVAAESKQLADQGLAPAREARKAAINLRTLQKKFAIVQRLLDGEIDATEAEIAWLSRKIDATDAADRDPLTIQRDRARTRLEAMRAVK